MTEAGRETRAYYDAIAAQTFRDWFTNPALLPTLAAFVSHLPRNPAVLDLGCGTGGESMRLSSLGAKVTGVDFSGESIRLARENAPGMNFILMDILELDFPPGSFDGVVEAGVLFHFNREEQDGILRALLACLKPGGRLLSYYPRGSFEGMQERSADSGRFRRYARQLSTQSWMEQVGAAGFSFVTEHPFEVGSFTCMEFLKGDA